MTKDDFDGRVCGCGKSVVTDTFIATSFYGPTAVCEHCGEDLLAPRGEYYRASAVVRIAATGERARFTVVKS